MSEVLEQTLRSCGFCVNSIIPQIVAVQECQVHDNEVTDLKVFPLLQKVHLVTALQEVFPCT